MQYYINKIIKSTCARFEHSASSSSRNATRSRIRASLEECPTRFGYDVLLCFRCEHKGRDTGEHSRISSTDSVVTASVVGASIGVVSASFNSSEDITELSWKKHNNLLKPDEFQYQYTLEK